MKTIIIRRTLYEKIKNVVFAKTRDQLMKMSYKVISDKFHINLESQREQIKNKTALANFLIQLKKKLRKDGHRKALFETKNGTWLDSPMFSAPIKMPTSGAGILK